MHASIMKTSYILTYVNPKQPCEMYLAISTIPLFMRKLRNQDPITFLRF